MLLCTGGCRSGKSEYARQWVEERGSLRVYLAAAYFDDDSEMADRIERHQRARGQGWSTFEVASSPEWDQPERWVADIARSGDVLLFDCLTLWTSLCLERGLGEEGLLHCTRRLLRTLADCGKSVAIVTNEVGMGLVPETPIGRTFRDVAGLVNQEAARLAGSVVLMVSGLPLRIK